MTKILVVDPNEAFATLLSEELQRQGYDIDTAFSSEDAIALFQKQIPDMAVLDMGLEEPDAIALAQQFREAQPGMRLMLIPLMGETLAQDPGGLTIQGVLTKPFFIPDLPDLITAALQAPLDAAEAAALQTAEPEPEPEPKPAVAAPARSRGTRSESARELSQHGPALRSRMDDLAQDVDADAVLLTCDEELIAWVGNFKREDAEAVAQAVIQSAKTSAELARILGSDQITFEQSISGKDYLLYALSVTDDVALAVVIRGSAALGLLRHSARRTANRIREYC